MYNATTSGITSYPTEVGCYRVVNGNIAGLPSNNNGYGTLFIANGGSYVMHLFIDAYNALYWCRTNGFGVPTTCEKASSTSVTAIS